jgi:hypothetical protein
MLGFAIRFYISCELEGLGALMGSLEFYSPYHGDVIVLLSFFV